ncbi:GHKL domain-containing protein [bacterium]|nr:GHKL domain-containing protein [bacterium]
MKKMFKIKRLKIAEQILIVLFCAVVAPMIISGIIINNINQHAIRAQLRDSAMLVANMVSEEIDVFISTAYNELQQVDAILKTIPPQNRNRYLNDLKGKFTQYEDLKIDDNLNNFDKLYKENLKKDMITLSIKTFDGKYLIAVYKLDEFKRFLFRSLKDDVRQIYIISHEKEVVAAHNFTSELFVESTNLLPKKLYDNKAVIFGSDKNQPICYYKKTNPNLMIIVNTTQKVTDETINSNRSQLLLAVFAASLSVFILVALYIYYMYINIRQLFKGIIAISQGNYQRQIRLLTNIFTPYEIVFLAFEFNKMVSQIHKSYKELEEKNIELAQLNEFRSNLIDTVSHELRTPLTSIQGYTSRLLRQDIQIDEEMRQKSLKIIKRQSERLKRMIEDLLVIPDIERARIKMNIEPVWIIETIENSKVLIKDKNQKEVISTVNEDFPLVLADKDRLEQVLLNLLDNAAKYAYEDTSIQIDGNFDEDFAVIKISNQADFIPEDKLNRLFEKFIRMDGTTTRTSRGTGLGLFIVKGLVEAMNGEISLVSTEDNVFTVELKLPRFKEAFV